MTDKGATGGREALLLAGEQVGDVKDASDKTPPSSDPAMQSSVQRFSTFKFDETVSVRLRPTGTPVVSVASLIHSSYSPP